ncbi:MAG: hypothetical protein U1G07_09910 [Verrucomicrobiota bacterium]
MELVPSITVTMLMAVSKESLQGHHINAGFEHMGSEAVKLWRSE